MILFDEYRLRTVFMHFSWPFLKKIHKCPRKTPFSGVLSLSLYDMTVRSTITLLAVMIIHGAKLPVCPHSPVDVGSVALRRKLFPVNARGINSPELCSPVLKASPSAQPCCLIRFDHIMLCRLVFAFFVLPFLFLFLFPSFGFNWHKRSISELFMNLLSCRKSMQFTNVIKNGRHCQVIGLDKRSEALEDMFICKALYASADFSEVQIGRRPAKMREEINGRKPWFEKIK